MQTSFRHHARIAFRVALLTLLLQAGSTTAAENRVTSDAPLAWDVFLLAGQSNMDGRGKVRELSAAHRDPFSSVLIFYRNPPAPTAAWKPLTPGYSIAPGYRGSLPSPTFGPEIGFARALVHSRPRACVALIKGSKGATSLSRDWNPGMRDQPATQGPCYSNFLETVALAMQSLTNDGSAAMLRGVLWHQGESDAQSTVGVYERQLRNLISRLREDLGQPELAFVVGEVFDNGKRDSVRTAQRKVAASVPRVAIVTADGLETSDAGTHFDAASQLMLGERFADAMLRFLPR